MAAGEFIGMGVTIVAGAPLIFLYVGTRVRYHLVRCEDAHVEVVATYRRWKTVLRARRAARCAAFTEDRCPPVYFKICITGQGESVETAMYRSGILPRPGTTP